MAENGNKDDRLRLHLEAIERLESEKSGIADDIKDRYALLKAEGYVPAIVRKVVALRKMKPDARREMEMVLDLYKAALGMDFNSTPLGESAQRQAA